MCFVDVGVSIVNHREQTRKAKSRVIEKKSEEQSYGIAEKKSEEQRMKKIFR